MPTLQTYSTMEAVERLAEFAHHNQTDKAGYPYFNHPERVMMTVRAQGAAPFVQMAAVLHDVTEDTKFDPQMLLDLGVPAAAVDIVRLVDRDASRKEFHSLNPDYDGALYNGAEIDEFYYANIRANPGALMVKLADIADNTQSWRLSYLPPETQERLKAKYAKAHQLLGVI